MITSCSDVSPTEYLAKLPFITLTLSANALIAPLPEPEFNYLSDRLERVFLYKGQVLFEPGEVAQHVYFPVGAIISMQHVMSDGRTTETHFFGATCMVGATAVEQPSYYRAVVRSAGWAFRLATPLLLEAFKCCPSFQQRSTRAIDKKMAQMAVGLNCLRRHDPPKQLVRWLLRTYDRLLEPVIRMTPSEIANTMGLSLESISTSLKVLEAVGALVCLDEGVGLLDRKKLEERVCECYQVDIRQRQKR